MKLDINKREALYQQGKVVHDAFLALEFARNRPLSGDYSLEKAIQEGIKAAESFPATYSIGNTGFQIEISPIKNKPSEYEIKVTHPSGKVGNPDIKELNGYSTEDAHQLFTNHVFTYSKKGEDEGYLGVRLQKSDDQ